MSLLLALRDRPVVSGGRLARASGAAVGSRRRPRLLAVACWGVLTYVGLLVRLVVRDVRR
ncbi:hypothetical protein BRC89_03090 [Halobacteriales archaeon QS_4_70_19]|nr:MAG: hypothetical protein BRC89_03090 [Halobacteriales archaeon QS_4_70_19]